MKMSNHAAPTTAAPKFTPGQEVNFLSQWPFEGYIGTVIAIETRQRALGGGLEEGVVIRWAKSGDTTFVPFWNERLHARAALAKVAA